MGRHFAHAAAAALLAMGAGSASAADLPVKAPPMVPPVVATWTGWYIGANAGWIGSNTGRITNVGTDTDGAGALAPLTANGVVLAPSLNYSGFLGGAQAGYNWQANKWVFGIEGDIDGSSAKVSLVSPTFTLPGFTSVGYGFTREIDWLATFRGRVGILAAPSFLLYGTGGLAVGGVKVGNQFICPTCAPPAATEATTLTSNSTTAAGWTAGAGAEWLFAPHWSAKVEYLYADLGRHSTTLTYTYPGNTSTITSSVRDTVNVVRVGVNYHFGGPVVAKY
jgi:outer membrane immunogenic protein